MMFVYYIMDKKELRREIKQVIRKRGDIPKQQQTTIGLLIKNLPRQTLMLIFILLISPACLAVGALVAPITMFIEGDPDGTIPEKTVYWIIENVVKLPITLSLELKPK
jgi:hypothetical protein